MSRNSKKLLGGAVTREDLSSKNSKGD